MYAAQKHDEFQELHYLRDFYEIGLENGAVRARYMGGELTKAQAVDPTHTRRNGGRRLETLPGGGVPHNEGGPLAVMVLKDVQSLEAVVGAGIRFKDEAEEISFPSAVLPHDAKKKLWLWGQSSGWRFIDHEEDGITLTRKPVDEELLWSPNT